MKLYTRFSFFIWLFICSFSPFFVFSDDIKLSHQEGIEFKTDSEIISVHLDASSRIILLFPDSLPKDSVVLLEKQMRKKRFISALLSFPLPFGIIGLHRVYLGSEPYIPIVYIGTLGGAFGILPLIDFISICRNKKIDRFLNNKRLMMWVK